MGKINTFKGISSVIPGAFAYVNDAGLSKVSNGTNGIIALIGEADGGPAGITYFNDASEAKSTYVSGPLADAQRLAFNPSSDPAIPGGAYQTINYKVNTGTQAQHKLEQIIMYGYDGGGSTTSSVKWDNPTYTLLTADAHINQKLQRINLSGNVIEERLIYDNTTTNLLVTPAFSTAPVAGDELRIVADVTGLTSVSEGVNANALMVQVDAGTTDTDAYVLALTDTNVTPSSQEVSDELGGRAYFTVEYLSTLTENFVAQANCDDTSANGITIKDTGGWTSTYTANPGRFVVVVGDDDDVTVKDMSLRYVTQCTANLLTVATGHAWYKTGGTGFPVSGDHYEVKDGQLIVGMLQADCGTRTLTLPTRVSVGTVDVTSTATVVVLATGGPMVTNMYAGMWLYCSNPTETRKILSNTDYTITLEGTGFGSGPVAASTLTVLGWNIFEDELVGMVVSITSGDGEGQRRIITADNCSAGASLTGATLTLDSDWAVTPVTGDTFSIYYITEAAGTIFGEFGEATGFKVRAKTNGAFPTVAGTATGSSTRRCVEWTGGGLTANAHIGKLLNWVDLTDNQTYSAVIDYNSTTFIYLVEPFDAAPANLDVLFITDWTDEWTFEDNETIQSFVTRVNGTAGYRAYVGDGIDGSLYMKDLDYVVSSDLTDATRASGDRGRQIFQGNQFVYYNAAFVGVADALSQPSVGTGRERCRNAEVELRTSYDADITNNNGFHADNYAFNYWINNYSNFVTAERDDTQCGGAEGPALISGAITTSPQDLGEQMGSQIYYDTTSSATASYAGTRGSSTSSDWQAAFTALLSIKHHHTVPLISATLTDNDSTAVFDSVCAQLQDFIGTAHSQEKNFMGGYLGMAGTKSQLIAKAQLLNDRDICLTGQEIYHLDVDGNLKWYDEWGLAVIMAAMRAGAEEVGTPLTYKYPGIYNLRNDSSWDPTNRTDVTALINGGVSIVAPVAGSGYRFIRDITTYVATDNLGRFQGSSRDSIRYIIRNIVDNIENNFVGKKGTRATAASVKANVLDTLRAMQNENVITESDDPVTGQNTKAWRNLVVTLNANVVSIKVQVYLVVAAEFFNVELQTQMASITV